MIRNLAAKKRKNALQYKINKTGELKKEIQGNMQ